MVDVLDRPETLDPKLRALLDDEEATEQYVYCAQCSNVLARCDAAIEINGAHTHFCVNPHGIEFDVRCYAQALGCAIAGEPTAADSWFPGYRWRFASCASCQIHLGWLFQGAEHQFYGLINDRIQSDG
ncbi:MAG: cereblon family protein [Pseudomonadota bacterium]